MIKIPVLEHVVLKSLGPVAVCLRIFHNFIKSYEFLGADV